MQKEDEVTQFNFRKKEVAKNYYKAYHYNMNENFIRLKRCLKEEKAISKNLTKENLIYWNYTRLV